MEAAERRKRARSDDIHCPEMTETSSPIKSLSTRQSWRVSSCSSYIRTDRRSPQGKDCSAKTQANSVMIKTEISAHASSSLHVSDTENVGRLSASAKGDVYVRALDMRSRRVSLGNSASSVRMEAPPFKEEISYCHE